MCKDMWIARVERLEDRFGCGDLTREEFRSELHYMGFNDIEIDELADRIQQEAV